MITHVTNVFPQQEAGMASDVQVAVINVMTTTVHTCRINLLVWNLHTKKDMVVNLARTDQYQTKQDGHMKL